jgi:hypothetical protein
MTNETVNVSDFLDKRIPPIFWDIVSYGLTITGIFYHTTPYLIFYTVLFILFGSLNILFEINTISFEHFNRNMPTYAQFEKYKYIVTSPLYVIKKKPINQDNSLGVHLPTVAERSKLKLIIHMYVGDNPRLGRFLYLIYLFGITKHNFTFNNEDDFSKNEISFV